MAALRTSAARTALSVGSSGSLHRNLHQIRGFSAATSAVLFPNERYGVDYATNWEISSMGVTVGGDAFKNAGGKTLAMHASAYDKGSKVLGLGCGGEESLYDGIDSNTFADIETDAQDVLSKANVLFLNDALPTPQVAVRTLTDDAAYAKLFADLMTPIALERCGDKPLQVLHSSRPDEEATGAYCAVAANKVVIRGAPSPALVAVALAKAAALQSGLLALPGLLAVDADGSLMQLVGPNGLDAGKADVKVVGSGASLLDGRTVYPLCRAVLAPKAKGGEARVGVDGLVLSPLEGGGSSSELKKVVMLSGESLGSMKKLDVGKAKDMYAALGFGGDVDLLEATLTENGIEVYSA